MVVLDGTIVTIGNTQYLQPDYMSPLNTTLDSKNSPLALLAQTCSQIGSDNSNGVKALLSADKNKASSGKMENAKSPTAAQKLIMDSSRNSNSSSPGSTKSSPIGSNGSSAAKNGLKNGVSVDTNNNSSSSSSETVKLAFKPYESEVLTGKASRNGNTRAVSDGRRSAENQFDPRSEKCHSPSTGNDSVSAGAGSASAGGDRKCSSNRSSSDENRTYTNSVAAPPQSSPATLRPGLESLPAEYAAMYKLPQLSSPYGAAGLSALGFPPGMDPQELLMNPAFRPPYATGYPSSVPPSAASMMGYHPALSPYFGFGAAAGGAMKQAASSDGVCKDPNCTGCQYSAAAQHHHQQMILGLCPPGCVQCQHHKYNMAMAAIQSNYQMPGAQPRALVCNWINGDSYCGKKFNSGEELMHHLKTHTAGLSDPTAAAAALIQAQLQPNPAALGLPPPGSLYPPSSAAGMQHRGYRTPPPLSPLSAMRYHPYAAAAAAAAASANKTGSPLPPLPSASYSSFNPALFSPYYSPYAFYGQRLGSTAVHQ